MLGRLRSIVTSRLFRSSQAPLAADSADTADAPERAAGAVVTAAATQSVAAAYYPSWSSYSRPPESLDFSKFDILFYAFATPSASHGLNWDDGSTAVLRRLVAAAKASGRGTRIVLSVGGWGGCQYFSETMGSSANRGTFITSLKNAVTTYGLDGIDIDWEYPNSAGAGQPYNPQDAANLLTFFTYLRKSLGASKIISAAVPDTPWLGADGRPLKDVSAFAAQMDYVNIMNYDVWGASAAPGPNAPLADGCGTSTQPASNATAAVKAWSAAGFPKGKLLLGLPLYGYVSKSTKKVLLGMAGAKAQARAADADADADRQAAIKAAVVAGATEDAAEMAPATQPAVGAATARSSKPAHDESEGHFLDGAHDRGPQKLAALIARPVTPPEPADVRPKAKKRWSLPGGGVKAKAADVALKKTKTNEASSDKQPLVEEAPTAEASKTEAPKPEAPKQEAPKTEVHKAAGLAQEILAETPGDGAKTSENTATRAAAGDFSASFGQQISFSDILSKGALVRSGIGYAASNGYTRAWDGCSNTPYLYNQSRSTVITYDDPQSLATKAAFAKSQGLAGCFTWSLDQDDGYSLQNSIRTALGK